VERVRQRPDVDARAQAVDESAQDRRGVEEEARPPPRDSGVTLRTFSVRRVTFLTC